MRHELHMEPWPAIYCQRGRARCQIMAPRVRALPYNAMVGLAAETVFYFKLENWEDDGINPVQYELRYFDPATGGDVPLVSRTATNEFLTVLPPVTRQDQSYELTIQALIVNKNQAKGSTSRQDMLRPGMCSITRRHISPHSNNRQEWKARSTPSHVDRSCWNWDVAITLQSDSLAFRCEKKKLCFYCPLLHECQNSIIPHRSR